MKEWKRILKMDNETNFVDMELYWCDFARILIVICFINMFKIVLCVF